VLELEVNHSRRFTQTGQFVVDRMRVTEVRVGKRLGKGKKEEILVTAYMQTEWFRQKIDVSLALAGAGDSVWSWSDRIVLGMKAADVIGGGALGALNASKSQKVEVAVPLTDEVRKGLATDPALKSWFLSWSDARPVFHACGTSTSEQLATLIGKNSRIS
jgi:hypothetical protein